jgi:hypothetical protein
LIEKCLAAPKVGVKSKASECILIFMEKDMKDFIIEDLIEGCHKKQPKIVAACYHTFSECLAEFGTTIINPKPILKILPEAFQHSDKTVRDEVEKFFFSFYQSSLLHFLSFFRECNWLWNYLDGWELL